jgi:hypothetical protein
VGPVLPERLAALLGSVRDTPPLVVDCDVHTVQHWLTVMPPLVSVLHSLWHSLKSTLWKLRMEGAVLCIGTNAIEPALAGDPTNSKETASKHRFFENFICASLSLRLAVAIYQIAERLVTAV